MQTVLAAGVHLFTALGSVCALFATLAIFDTRFEAAFAWLLVALVIDAVDGTMARAVRVRDVLPRFSGERLDLVIDYATYVFVPVLALLAGGVLVGAVGKGLAAAILLSSLFHFSDEESKADDNCFVGFPAVWNLVAFCLFAWGMRGGWAHVGVAVLVILTFVPMRWLHPMRVKRLFGVTLAMTLFGLAAAIWTLVRGFPADWLAGAALGVAGAYFVALACLWPWVGGAAASR